MKINHVFLALIISVIFFACESDENTSSDPMLTIEEQQALTLNAVAGDDEKVLRISEAILENTNGQIDISSNFNIEDDEFIMVRSGNQVDMEWRRGYDIDADAADAKDALRDYYRSPVNETLSFATDQGMVLSSTALGLIITLEDDNSITGVFQNLSDTPNTQSSLRVKLVEKTEDDYVSPPENGLFFTESFKFNSGDLNIGATGMAGSYSENSLYIANRESAFYNGNGFPERIIKYDYDTNQLSDNLFYQSDLVSKQILIKDDQLLVLGCRYVNFYDLNSLGEPDSYLHGQILSRFGTAVIDNELFAIGGDLDWDNPDTPDHRNKIFAYDWIDHSYAIHGELPEARFGSRGTIIDNTLYTFGGTEELFENPPVNTIFKMALNGDYLDTLTMTEAFNYTYVDKKEHLIYIAGFRQVVNESNEIVGREFGFGVFNTIDDSYISLETNLEAATAWDSVHGMCIFNNKMYIIFGAFGEDTGGDLPEWTVYEADL